MTSIYKTDMGNGVVIKADEYVRTGQWVFQCGRSRLVSRVPLPVPIGELKKAHTLSLGIMYHLSETDKELAKEVIATVIAMPDWYQSLEYLYSVLDENSDLNSHLFGLLVEHEDRLWVLTIWQKIHGNGESSFTVIPEAYDPETYMNHAKALEVAEKSCTASQ